MPETEGQNKTNANFGLLNNSLIKQKCEDKPQLSKPLYSTTSSPVLWDKSDHMATCNKFSAPQNITNLNFSVTPTYLTLRNDINYLYSSLF